MTFKKSTASVSSSMTGNHAGVSMPTRSVAPFPAAATERIMLRLKRHC